MSYFSKTYLPKDVFDAIADAEEALRDEIRLSNSEESKKSLRALQTAMLFIAPEIKIIEKAANE